MGYTVKDIESKQDFDSFGMEHPEFELVMFYSSNSRNSVESREVVRSITEENGEAALALIDVQQVKEIHPVYEVKVVPTVLSLKKGKVVRRLEGKQNRAMYDALFHDAPVRNADSTTSAPPRVTVYSTPTCPHCTTVKSYLRKNRIRFNDIDVSRDTRAGEELTRRSGSMGVPQTDINGTIVVGADLTRLNELLGIGRN